MKFAPLRASAVRWLMFLSTVLALPTWAQNYTFEALEQLMRENSPALRMAAQMTEEARGAVRTARTFPNPSYESLSGPRRSLPAGVSAGQSRSSSLTQPLDMPWNRFPRVDAAENGLLAAIAAERSFLNESRARLRLGFFELIRREGEQRAAQEDLSLMQNIRQRIALRVETGESPRFELIKADAETLNAQKAFETASARTRQARAALRAIVGPSLPENFLVEGLIGDIGTPIGLEQARAQMFERNPELIQARALRDQAQNQLSEQRALRMPQIALRAELDQDPEMRARRDGVQLTLPIWDWRGGPVAEAGARLAQSESQLEFKTFSLQQSLDVAYQQHAIAQAQLRALESGILKQAEQALRIAETAYRAGEKGFLEVLDARRVFRAARNEIINARYELAAAWTEIARLSDQP